MLKKFLKKGGKKNDSGGIIVLDDTEDISGEVSAVNPRAARYSLDGATRKNRNYTFADEDDAGALPKANGPDRAPSAQTQSISRVSNSSAGSGALQRQHSFDESHQREVDPDDEEEVNVGLNARLSLDGDIEKRNQRQGEETASQGAEGVVLVDDKLELPIQIGTCGKPGWEPLKGPNKRQSVEIRKENQDAYCAHAPFMGHPLQMFFGVFDGHGAEGRSISHFARDSVARVLNETYQSMGFKDGMKEIENEAKQTEIHRSRFRALRTAFQHAEKGLMVEGSGIDHVFSGTTGVCAWVIGPDLYCGWVGDSRCILGRKTTQGGRDRIKAIDMSYDQKPIRPDEKKRVRAAGGRIARWRRNLGPLRVWLPRDWIPGLAMTRSIGDTILTEYGVMPVPEMAHLRLTQLDSFLVLASDGIWEFMSSQEVADYVGKLRSDGINPDEAAEALVREAVRRWRRNEVVVDDTTAVVVYLDFEEKPASSSEKRTMKNLFSVGKKASTGDRPMQVMEDGRLVPFNPKNDPGPSN
uniref:PPM-type phosphatase domain-containing protein n=1 Tax=Compsopogon caeruleus TaxID=31354 RepID=A0A7S1TEC7_9RHOD|mmetsp:Transcript_2556/g.4492  ORF Transcript_2556/g.4492 Transcript_2556/m.4492 type:complete len:525 (+) Transcript_2556:253-1827(+)